MPAYEDDDRFEPIAPIQPIRRVQSIRAIRRMRPGPYFGHANPRPPTTDDTPPSDPAAIVDISPEGREQAHHSDAKAQNTDTQA